MARKRSGFSNVEKRRVRLTGKQRPADIRSRALGRDARAWFQERREDAMAEAAAWAAQQTEMATKAALRMGFWERFLVFLREFFSGRFTATARG